MNKEILELLKNKNFKIMWPEDLEQNHTLVLEEKPLSKEQEDFVSNLVEITDKYNFEIFGHTDVYTDDFNKNIVAINIKPKVGFSGLKTKLFVYQF